MIYKMLIYGLCGGSLFLLSVLLLFNLPKVNRNANLFLGICSFFLASVFVQLLLENATTEIPSLLLLCLEVGRWAILPSFFVALSLYISPQNSRTRYFIHFVPTIMLLILLLGHPALPPFGVYVVQYFLYFQFLVYGFWSFSILYGHRASVGTFTSQPKDIDLHWITSLLCLLLVLGVLSLAVRFFPSISHIVDALYLLCVLYYSYSALSQIAIYPVVDEQVPIIKAVGISKDKERLSGEQVQFFQKRLLTLMGEERPYLDPSINLPILADRVGLSVHELSYVLNAGIGLNFYQFVNGYRIRHAQSLLREISTNGYTIYEILIRSGFNSKTTFYTAFKQETGMTPKDYLQRSQ